MLHSQITCSHFCKSSRIFPSLFFQLEVSILLTGQYEYKKHSLSDLEFSHKTFELVSKLYTQDSYISL